MTRDDLNRLTDIENAVLAIRSHLSRGSLDDGLVFDAVRVRLIEIGEAVKGLTAAARSVCPDVPWADIAHPSGAARRGPRLARRPTQPPAVYTAQPP